MMGFGCNFCDDYWLRFEILIVGLGLGIIIGFVVFNFYIIFVVCVFVFKVGFIKYIWSIGVWIVELIWLMWVYIWFVIIL